MEEKVQDGNITGDYSEIRQIWENKEWRNQQNIRQ
jgi:hypothetical protein